MRAGRLLLLAGFGSVTLVAAFAVRQRLERRHAQEQGRMRTLATLADSAFADSVLRAAEDLGTVVTVRRSDLPAPVRDEARIADLLATRGPATFLAAMLADRDSTNYRWPDRRADPVSVWIQDATLDGYDSALHGVVERAFGTWSQAEIPVEFRFVFDSARADVHVTWVDRYESRTTGRTRWAHDQHDWILGADIVLALHQPDGRALEPRASYAIALHEVGHLLGLDHSPDALDIMAANVRVSELSERDLLTLRLVYALPPGRVLPH
ncbi:MAG: M10 family metallopeptidase domain-containing protein [Gemmatimonadota bacterium]|nr:M10 family metallopeptidase domain-containing protein [Gemmatimonadota bacterium]